MNRIAKYEDIEQISKLRILQQKDEYPNKDEELYRHLQIFIVK